MIRNVREVDLDFCSLVVRNCAKALNDAKFNTLELN